jgi:arylsulfatase A-like enzyme
MMWKSTGLAILACMVAVLSCGQDDRPLNVMIIGVDTLRPDHLGCYGYGRNTSPNIDRFAGESVLCENAMSPAPWTLPSFATVFTSLYPTQHGANAVRSRMRSSFPTLATVLCDRGYATGAIINAPALKPANGVDRGFNCYDTTPLGGRNADGTTRNALEWIDSTGDRPFFIFVHYFDPHLSYSPPPPYDTLFDPGYEGRIGDSFDIDEDGFSRIRDTMFAEMRALTAADWNHIVSLYDGEIAFADKAIDDLLEGLQARNLRDNTLIIFLSDHGEEFYEHGGFEHGHSLYNELIWVPLMFSLPGVLPQGVRLARRVRLLDVMPTILDILGIDREPHFEGVSLKPLLEGTGTVTDHQGCLLSPDVAFAEAIMHGLEMKSVTAYPLKLIHHMTTGEEMLFDLDDDPEEMRNLIDQELEVASGLKEILFKTLFEISDTWYIELAGGGEDHTVDLEITAEKGPGIGIINLYKLFAGNGDLLDPGEVLYSKASGSVLKLDGLNLKGTVTLAFKVDLPRIPIRFDFRIDGRSAGPHTCMGKSLASPDEMPFIIKGARGRVKSEGRPSGTLAPPYLLLWYSEGKYRGDTAITLDQETKKELKALGYIQ